LLRSSSWLGFVPAIHVFLAQSQGVDAWHKAGHDQERGIFQLVPPPVPLSLLLSHLVLI